MDGGTNTFTCRWQMAYLDNISNEWEKSSREPKLDIRFEGNDNVLRHCQSSKSSALTSQGTVGQRITGSAQAWEIFLLKLYCWIKLCWRTNGNHKCQKVYTLAYSASSKIATCSQLWWHASSSSFFIIVMSNSSSSSTSFVLASTTTTITVFAHVAWQCCYAYFQIHTNM